MRGRLHDGARRQPVGVDRGLEAEGPEPGRRVLHGRASLSEGGGDGLLQGVEAWVLVERQAAQRRERRVEEAQVIVALHDEARARDGLAGGGMDDAPREAEVPLERLAVGREPDGDAQRRELPGGDLVQALPGDLPDDRVLALHPRAADYLRISREMTMRCISLVPSPISVSLASRK